MSRTAKIISVPLVVLAAWGTYRLGEWTCGWLFALGRSLATWLADCDWSALRRGVVSVVWLGIIFYFLRVVRGVARYWEARARQERRRP